MGQTAMMTVPEAYGILEKLQRRCLKKGIAPCRAFGVPVSAEAISGNGFRFTCTANRHPGFDGSISGFEDIGASVRIGNGRNGYAAETTWDTALHYLVRTGNLCVPA